MLERKHLDAFERFQCKKLIKLQKFLQKSKLNHEVFNKTMKYRRLTSNSNIKVLNSLKCLIVCLKELFISFSFGKREKEIFSIILLEPPTTTRFAGPVEGDQKQVRYVCINFSKRNQIRVASESENNVKRDRPRGDKIWEVINFRHPRPSYECFLGISLKLEHRRYLIVIYMDLARVTENDASDKT